MRGPYSADREEPEMKTTRQTVRKAQKAAQHVQRVVRTTVGDLIAGLVDSVGADQTRDLLTAKSPLQKALRQRLVLV
jgi:hypothetical protein